MRTQSAVHLSILDDFRKRQGGHGFQLRPTDLHLRRVGQDDDPSPQEGPKLGSFRLEGNRALSEGKLSAMRVPQVRNAVDRPPALVRSVPSFGVTGRVHEGLPGGLGHLDPRLREEQLAVEASARDVRPQRNPPPGSLRARRGA